MRIILKAKETLSAEAVAEMKEAIVELRELNEKLAEVELRVSADSPAAAGASPSEPRELSPTSLRLAQWAAGLSAVLPLPARTSFQAWMESEEALQLLEEAEEEENADGGATPRGSRGACRTWSPRRRR